MAVLDNIMGLIEDFCPLLDKNESFEDLKNGIEEELDDLVYVQYDAGYDDGIAKGYDDGFTAGVDFQEGQYSDGFEAGKDVGFYNGYEQGLTDRYAQCQDDNPPIED